MLHAVKASPWLNSILIETRKANSRRAVLGPYSFGCLPGTLLRGITCLISWWRLFRLLFLASPNTSSLVSSISLPWWTHGDLSASRLLTAAREALILVFWQDQGGYVLRLYPKAQWFSLYAMHLLLVLEVTYTDNLDKRKLNKLKKKEKKCAPSPSIQVPLILVPQSLLTRLIKRRLRRSS